MSERIITNSKNLQKKFTEIYEDFFTKNNLIISSPQVINRWHITHLKGIKIKITQKMSTKMYMGINIRKDDEIHLQKYIEYISAEQKFKIRNIEIEENTKQTIRMRDTIKKKLSEFGFTKWIDITVLSENQRGTGVATATIEAMLLSLTIHILWGKLLPEQFDDYEKFMKSKEYISISAMTQELISTITWIPKEDINNTVIFTAAIYNGNLCVWYDNKRHIEHIHPKVLHIDNNICVQHINPEAEYALECSIINIGAFFDEFYNRETYANLEKQYLDACEKFQIGHNKTSIFLDETNFLYLNILEAEKESSLHPTDEEKSTNLFNQINKLWLYQTFIENYMTLYKEIMTTFQNNITFDDEQLWLLPISSCKPWGTFKCFTKKQKSRETLKKTVDELRKKWFPTANLQRMSWEDGISKEKIQIEQYLEKGNVSNYIHDNDAVLELWSDETEQKIIGKHRELIRQKEETMIFDCIDGKIYINNELTNHKEILSQSGTVEIMKVIFENMGKYVNNSKLPVSSYTKNKNEMVGKIIWPLQELVKKRFNEKLNLECTGNIMDFDLKLTPNKIHIWLLKKIIN